MFSFSDVLDVDGHRCPWFVVELPEPKSKSNHRMSDNNWGKFAKFEEEVSARLSIVLPSGWVDDDSDVPVADRNGYGLLLFGSCRLDTTNLSKSVADAAEGVCYVNDAQVRVEFASSVRSSKDLWLYAVFVQFPPGLTQCRMESALGCLIGETRDVLPV